MRLSSREYCDFLRSTQLDLFIPIPESSNEALLCSTEDPDIWCVYKPQRNERPLSDFPPQTLAQREVAAYHIAMVLGMNYIPPTVLVEGPYGLGSVQLWVGKNPGIEESADITLRESSQSGDLVMLAAECPASYLPVMYIELASQQELILMHADSTALEEIAFLDLLLNNADRKGSHIMAKSTGLYDEGKHPHIWAIDHGLCFHTQWKLRTVLWGFASRALSDTLQKTLSQVPDLIANIVELPELLTAAEITALIQRAKILAAEPVFPSLHYSTQLPWPWF